jgi:hypothetical protein
LALPTEIAKAVTFVVVVVVVAGQVKLARITPPLLICQAVPNAALFLNQRLLPFSTLVNAEFVYIVTPLAQVDTPAYLVFGKPGSVHALELVPLPTVTVKTKNCFVVVVVVVGGTVVVVVVVGHTTAAHVAAKLASTKDLEKDPT